MWARVLGDDLYELQNSPFFAYGVSYLDVVRAVSPEPGLKPHVVELVRPGGHVTLRVMFLDADSRERQAAILDKLASLGADPERASTSLCALDLPPGVPVDPIRDELDRLEEAGELAYETCEARVPGSFDDHPPDVDAQARACR